jgi:hypothetical protein
MSYIVKTESKDCNFTPTHKYGKFFISLNMREGSMSTNLMYFERCMNVETFEENGDVFNNLLIEFLKKPEDFITHWIPYMKLEKIKMWVNSMKFYWFEFTLQESENSGPFHSIYKLIPEVISLSEKFKSFKNNYHYENI